MKVSLYFIISLLLFSCSNYSINYETEIDTKRIFSDGYNTDESLSEHGSFKYGNVLLENTSKDEKLEYTFEKK